MSDDEVALRGGNASDGVVRVGETVRKPAGPGAASVRRYVEFLRDRDIEAPEPLGAAR